MNLRRWRTRITTKRDSKRKQKADKRPKLKKEKLSDLDTKGKGEGVKGGAPRTARCN